MNRIDRVTELILIASQLAADTPRFQVVRGPGDGDRSTHNFMTRVRGGSPGLVRGGF